MGKTDCKEHSDLSTAIKSNGQIADILREILKDKNTTREQKIIVNDALVAEQNAIVELVHKRSLHIKECGECKKGE